MDNTVFQMQQAARRRVMEAHEHARRIVQQDACRPARDTGALATKRPCAPSSGGGEDTEQFLLLILAFFLYKNGASPQVLLALLYLAL